MSTYDDSSLFLYPSGYKASVLFAQKPMDANGQLAFTRSNDTATRVDENLLIEKVRTNLALQSQTFDNASWTKEGSSVTANGTTDPFGASNADVVVENAAASTQHRLLQTVTISNSTEYSTSLYVKRMVGTRDFAIINIISGSRVYFNLTTGAVGAEVLGKGSIQNVGNGWYRCSVTGLSTGTSTALYLALTNGTTAGSETYSGDGVSSLAFYGAQLETGVTTDYIVTTSAAVSVGPVASVPRLDYLNSSCPRLLLEPQRQNVCLWSEQIDNAGWIKTNAPTITTNIATAPDGYGGADGIQDTTGSTFKRINQNFSVSANSTVTASVFVKKETTETNYGGMALAFSGGTTNVAYSIVDAVNGTATLNTGTIGSASTKIEDYGTYYRVTLTATDSGSNTTVGFSYYGTLSTNGTTTGLGAGSVRTVWGFQVEIGAAYATSYIPTLGAAVTRGADLASASYTGLTTTSGSLFIDLKEGFAGQNINSVVASLGLRFSSTGTQDSVGLRDATSGTLQGVMRVGGTASNLGAVISGTAATKVCFVWTASTVKMFKDGALFGSASISTPAVFDTTELPNSVRTVSAPLAQFLIFPTALSDADAIALTA